ALARHADLQAALVDAGMDRVGLEVERDGAPGRAARAVRVVPATPRQQHNYRNQGKESAHGGEEYGRAMNATEVTEVEDRGPAAYLAEFLGTLVLVLFITAAVSLYVTSPSAQ